MLVLGMYMASALVGSSIAVNADWTPPKQGISVYIYDNGVHTSLIFKRDFDGYDLGLMAADPPVKVQRAIDSPTDTRLVWPDQLPDNRFPGAIREFPYFMIGWGDARFYRETPTWSDVRPGTALAALFGSGESMIHVDRLRHIPYRNVKKLVLRDEEFVDLLLFVQSHFPSSFETRVVPEAGYGIDDRFFPISPVSYTQSTPDLHYSALFTCNNWVSHALAQAGVKTGKWTPLPFGVMWWY